MSMHIDDFTSAEAQVLLTALLEKRFVRLPAMEDLRHYRLAKLHGSWTGIARGWYEPGRICMLSDGRSFPVPHDVDVVSDITIRFKVTAEEIHGEVSIRTDLTPLGIEEVETVTGSLREITFDMIDLHTWFCPTGGTKIELDLTLSDEGDTVEGRYWYPGPAGGTTCSGIVALLKVTEEETAHVAPPERCAVLSGVWQGKGKTQDQRLDFDVHTVLIHRGGGVVRGRALLSRPSQKSSSTEVVYGRIEGRFLTHSLIQTRFQALHGKRLFPEADLKLELSTDGWSAEGIYSASAGLTTGVPDTGPLILRKSHEAIPLPLESSGQRKQYTSIRAKGNVGDMLLELVDSAEESVQVTHFFRDRYSQLFIALELEKVYQGIIFERLVRVYTEYPKDYEWLRRFFDKNHKPIKNYRQYPITIDQLLPYDLMIIDKKYAVLVHRWVSTVCPAQKEPVEASDNIAVFAKDLMVTYLLDLWESLRPKEGYVQTLEEIPAFQKDC